MFTKVRREDRQLSEAETKAVLVKGTYGLLSMNGEHPYGVPMSYVYKENSLYFHCATEGKKLDCIMMNNSVSFCVVSEAYPLPDAFSMKYTSTIAFGKIVEIDDDEKLEALLALIDKYASDNDYKVKGREYALSSLQRTKVLKMDIEHLTGKSRR